MEASPAELSARRSTRKRVGTALLASHNWVQLAQFAAVGASGYVVNLVVYVALIRAASFPYLVASFCSFLVAAANNYGWNRVWTFRHQRGPLARQGVRFLTVSTAALLLNLACLRLLVLAGTDKVGAQALAIVLVMPLNFVGNKLWSFRVR